MVIFEHESFTIILCVLKNKIKNYKQLNIKVSVCPQCSCLGNSAPRDYIQKQFNTVVFLSCFIWSLYKPDQVNHHRSQPVSRGMDLNHTQCVHKVNALSP